MNVVSQFLSFDKLMGSSLVKIVYFLGIFGIALGLLFGVLGAFAAMTVNFMAGLGTLIAVPIGCIIAVCFLRFACELYIAIFRIADDISAIRGGGSPMAKPAPVTPAP
jgi:hypothetical protein